MRRIQGYRFCAIADRPPGHILSPYGAIGALAMILALATCQVRAGPPSKAASSAEQIPRFEEISGVGPPGPSDPPAPTSPLPPETNPEPQGSAEEIRLPTDTESGRAGSSLDPAVRATQETDDTQQNVEREAAVWWEEGLSSSILRDRQPLPFTLSDAFETALDQAPELKALHNEYSIRAAEIIRQDAAFDWTGFIESIWNRDSNPVGTLLDGTPNRLRTYAWGSSAGVRRRNRLGGDFSISQDYGFLNSNSAFILPNNQGTARLGLQYEQPLLRGRGRLYNESGIGLAIIARDISCDELQIGIQNYLLEVASSYWSLVLARGRYVQLIHSWQRAVATADEMENRVKVDVRPNQLNRVRTEVTKRWADSTDARYNVLRFQERLLRSVLGPAYAEYADSEVITTSAPQRLHKLSTLDEAVQTALRHRSEVHQAIRRIRISSTELGIAENEVLPALNVVVSTYVAGLRGNANIPGAYVDQFTEGEPGAGAGFNFEYPLGNRAAQTAARQRRLAVARFRNNLQAVIAQVTLNVRDQATESNKYAEVLDIKYDALQQAVRDLRYLETRKQFLVDGSRVADLYLEDMLQSQERLRAAEFSFLDSQIRGALAFAALARATGILSARAEIDQSVR